ncbi:MAG TPA: glutamate 5-kinase [Acidimicrobiales bacterium]|nr:glutamate 5-kinase [Acidimicrobiales bacterium]
MAARAASTVVVKVGSSTITTAHGEIDTEVVGRLSREVAARTRAGDRIVLVTSGAIACGWAALGRPGPRPSDLAVLQAVSAVGQQRLMRAWQDGLAATGLLAGQVLLAPLDFGNRRQYLHARATLQHLWHLGVVPVVNENDAVADDEIRYGDNDRLAALVAHLCRADLLVLLTDTPGLLSVDPRIGGSGSLIEEVMEIDQRLMDVAGGPGAVGSGGMASKLAAARMASRSGVGTVIADGRRPGVVTAALDGVPGVGTTVAASAERMPARKLWIAYAIGASGQLVVDDGARRALVERGRSLLPAGVVECRGQFDPDDAVEISAIDGDVFAKGIVRYSSARAPEWVRRRSEELPEDLSPVAVHRDDLVVLT